MRLPNIKNKRVLLITASVLISCIIIVSLFFIVLNFRYRSIEKKINSQSPELSEDYYFNQLTYKEQLLYKSIRDAAKIRSEKTDILPYKFSENEFIRSVKAVNFDNPQFFYLDFNSVDLYCDNYKTVVYMDYFTSEAETSKMNMEMEAVCAAAEAVASKFESDFEKTVAIHDFLTASCTYINQNSNENYENLHTSYGALVDKKASCDGYSSAFKILLNRCGIECIIAEGTIDGLPHLWNIVKQNGKYYHIDCTWNDADVDSLSSLLFHGFFNLSDRAVLQDRKPDQTFKMPVCNDETNYYTTINARAESLENLQEVAYNQLKKAVENKNIYFEFLPDFTCDEGDFKKHLLSAIDKINSEYSSPILSRSYRLYDTSVGGYAYTVQIYYINN